jgi:prevent-host-death family protein
MRAVTIKNAKAHLNELIEAAEAGEQVVLMRGTKHVAAIVPIDERDLELVLGLGDEQAARLWQALASERESGKTRVYPSVREAVQVLSDVRTARPLRKRRR